MSSDKTSSDFILFAFFIFFITVVIIFVMLMVEKRNNNTNPRLLPIVEVYSDPITKCEYVKNIGPRMEIVGGVYRHRGCIDYQW